MDKISLFRSAANVHPALNAPLLLDCQRLVLQESIKKLLDRLLANHALLGQLARIVTPYLIHALLDTHHFKALHHALPNPPLLAILQQALTNLLGPTEVSV
jgi:hypothetical protein